MLGRKKREKVRSTCEHLCYKKETNVSALMARTDCSLISEQRVQI